MTTEQENELARQYSLATQRMHDVVNELYEAIHTDKGRPRIYPSQVGEQLNKAIIAITEEGNGIREAVRQLHE